MKRQRAPGWTLAKLFSCSPTALAVWCVLCDLSDKRRSPIVTPTRDELARAVGIDRLKTISTALTLLEAAGWIDRAHVPVTDAGKRTATLLRIVLRRKGRCTAPYGAQRRKGRCTAPRVRGAAPPQDSLLQREAVPVGPSRRSADGPPPAAALSAPKQDFENAGPSRSIADIAAEVFGQKGNA